LPLSRWRGAARAEESDRAPEGVRASRARCLPARAEADEAHPEHRALAIRVAASVLDRTGHKQPEKLEIEPRQTIDVRTLSTPLVRRIVAELRLQEARNRAALTLGPPADDRSED
jgi:hypothetical protein